MSIDKLILGDNQFFGVNHMSQDKGRETYEKFKDIEEIKKIIYYAKDNGVTGLFFSTHPSIYQITDMIRKDSTLRNELGIYVNVPYIIKYVQMMNEMGAYRTVRTVLKGNSLLQNIDYGLRTAINVLQGDYLKITNRLVEVEMNPFHGLNVKSVFLHNSLVDLAIGYDLDGAVVNFHDFIRKKYQVTPGFGTLNFPRLDQMLNRNHVKDVIVMTSVNKLGFLMNPGRTVCEESLRNTQYDVLAMATLASGSLLPDEAFEYLFSLPTIKSVVVGVSSKKHADETFKLLRQHMGI